jgi:hypothetical protein
VQNAFINATGGYVHFSGSNSGSIGDILYAPQPEDFVNCANWSTAMIRVDFQERTNVELELQTSVDLDSDHFEPVTGGTGVTTSRAVAVNPATATIPIMRYLRFVVKSTTAAAAWSVTFQVQVLLKNS